METQTETQTIPMFDNKLSLYIPRIMPQWAYEEAVKNKFQSLNIGNIERVDFVYNENDDTPYYQAFIHFTSWFENVMTKNLQEKIFNPEKVAKLVFDDPWYWILLPNKNPRTENEVRIEKHIKMLEASIEWSNSQSQEYVRMVESRISSLENEVRSLSQAAGRPPYSGPLPPISSTNTDMEISQLTAAMSALSISDRENDMFTRSDAYDHDTFSGQTSTPLSPFTRSISDTFPPPPPALRRSAATQSANERLMESESRDLDQEMEDVQHDLYDTFTSVAQTQGLSQNRMPDLWRDACIAAGINPITQSPPMNRPGFNSPIPR